VSLLIFPGSQNFLARINGLSFDDHLLGNYDVPVRIDAAGFESSALAGELDGGTLSGEVSYLDNKFHLKLDLIDLPYRRVAEGVEGKIKGKIQLDGHGADTAQIVRSLSGNFTMIGGAGKLTSNVVNSWTRDLLSTIFPGRRAETKLRCAIADFGVKGGIARSRAIVIDTNEVSIFGRGSVDLNRQYVDVVLSPKPKSMELVSVATPVQVRGPIDNVGVRPVGKDVAKRMRGMLLGIVNPAMLLLPLIEMGSGDTEPCLKYLQQKQAP
jgi:uncharacterized protein involved in outer membrane biogenesis